MADFADSSPPTPTPPTVRHVTLDDIEVEVDTFPDPFPPPEPVFSPMEAPTTPVRPPSSLKNACAAVDSALDHMRKGTTSVSKSGRFLPPPIPPRKPAPSQP